MSAPTKDDVKYYLGDNASTWDDDHLYFALAAEKAAQSRSCNVPADDADWPEDLKEALCRRVIRNLYMRSLPSGLQQVTTELGGAFARVGADPEVKRLEGPFRKVASRVG